METIDLSAAESHILPKRARSSYLPQTASFVVVGPHDPARNKVSQQDHGSQDQGLCCVSAYAKNSRGGLLGMSHLDLERVYFDLWVEGYGIEGLVIRAVFI